MGGPSRSRSPANHAPTPPQHDEALRPVDRRDRARGRGGAPRWADGKNPPKAYRQSRNAGWRPNAKLYGQFVRAVADRYDGHFRPSGASSPLPAVAFWSLWNEPNLR